MGRCLAQKRFAGTSSAVTREIKALPRCPNITRTARHDSHTDIADAETHETRANRLIAQLTSRCRAETPRKSPNRTQRGASRATAREGLMPIGGSATSNPDTPQNQQAPDPDAQRSVCVSPRTYHSTEIPGPVASQKPKRPIGPGSKADRHPARSARKSRCSIHPPRPSPSAESPFR